MPPQFQQDNYDKCLNEPDGVYCSVEFALVSDAPSDLLTMIQEYSENSDRHFNHTKPHYGICLTQSCRSYIKDKAVGTKESLEGCLNESLWNEYKLKTKVLGNIKCTKSNEEVNVDGADIATFDYVGYQFGYNATIIVQIFFLISGLLLSYNLQIAAETKTLDWLEIPKRIGIRWLRLTPPYAIVLAITSTWLKYAGSGPFWKIIVNDAVTDCRQSWWIHLFYIRNYYKNSKCMLHAWYVAADFQLHIVGLILCVLFKGHIRRIFLVVLLMIGVIAPAFHTYFQDLNGSLVVTLEMIRNIYTTDPTFVNVYTPTHTNIACFVIGLALGLIIYNMKNRNFDIAKYRKYLPMYYAIVPVGFALAIAGMAAYRDGPRLSIYIRVLFSLLLKPVFGMCIAVLIFGMVFKFEGTIRGFLEARIWTVICRVSYCAYLCHIALVRMMTGSSIMIRVNVINLINLTLGMVFMAFLIAVVLYLFVEAPFLGIIDTIRARDTSHRKASVNSLKNKKLIEGNTAI
ncbi:nose resistant to fluoxetine protein 6-like [Colias croceus]|uniref:nose resistant to fluoxetine protein 6-like n=1 Tax=Colias crocea TaxID=72248 RepID=UPI001E27E68D|nr:nose resistant to fluoxetine protein 6-like [Colias croceus]